MTNYCGVDQYFQLGTLRICLWLHSLKYYYIGYSTLIIVAFSISLNPEIHRNTLHAFQQILFISNKRVFCARFKFLQMRNNTTRKNIYVFV